MIRAALADAPGGGPDLQVDLATPHRFVELLLSPTPGLCIHVSCHGRDTDLQFEDNIGCLRPLPIESLNKCLANPTGHTRPEVVVLLSCNSHPVGECLIKGGVRRVVCTRGSLPDAVATVFSRHFWRGIGMDYTIEEAFTRAMVLLRAHGNDAACDSNMLVLLPENPVSGLPAPSTEDAVAPRTSNPQPEMVRQRSNLELPILAISEPEDFLGRELLLCQVLALFDGRGSTPRRTVCVHGPSGMGKTAFAKYLARFAHTPGRLFDDGVLYDPAWKERVESLPWLWLEAAYHLGGLSSWEQEEAGLHPALKQEELIQALISELLRQRSKRRWLLIVDDACQNSLQSCLGRLLDGVPGVSILLTSTEPWSQDIVGFKVVNVPLLPLDALSSAKLFLRRVRRPLRSEDFEEPVASNAREMSMMASCSIESVPTRTPTGGSRMDRTGSYVGKMPSGWQVHVTALLQHPLLHLLGGHPGHIRKAAVRVTAHLPSLHDLVAKLPHILEDRYVCDTPQRPRPRAISSLSPPSATVEATDSSSKNGVDEASVSTSRSDSPPRCSRH